MVARSRRLCADWNEITVWIPVTTHAAPSIPIPSLHSTSKPPPRTRVRETPTQIPSLTRNIQSDQPRLPAGPNRRRRRHTPLWSGAASDAAARAPLRWGTARGRRRRRAALGARRPRTTPRSSRATRPRSRTSSRRCKPPLHQPQSHRFRAAPLFGFSKFRQSASPVFFSCLCLNTSLIVCGAHIELIPGCIPYEMLEVASPFVFGIGLLY